MSRSRLSKTKLCRQTCYNIACSQREWDSPRDTQQPVWQILQHFGYFYIHNSICSHLGHRNKTRICVYPFFPHCDLISFWSGLSPALLTVQLVSVTYKLQRNQTHYTNNHKYPVTLVLFKNRSTTF